MKDERLYVIHMLECLDRIEQYSQLGRDHFLSNPMEQDATIRNFEILGEASKRMSEATRSRAPANPWTLIAGFRDVLIHQYEGVDLEKVWRHVEHDIPPLKTNLARLLDDLNRNQSMQ